MKKILFINHSATFGGAQRSLYEYMKLIDKKKFDLYILSPKQSNSLLREFNFIQFNYIPKLYNTCVGGYKGIRYLLLLREIFYSVLFFFYCIKLKIKYKNFDLIHFNEITLLPCLVIKIFFKSKITTHLRSGQNMATNTILTKIFKYFSVKFFWKIISIDNDIFDGSYSKEKTLVFRNILSSHFGEKKIKHKKNNKIFVVTYVGTLIKSKGIMNLITIAQKLEKFHQIQFHVYGGIPEKNIFFYLSKFFNNEYLDTSKINIKNIFFFGEKNSLELIYKNSDITIFCSNLNAIGRPVLEAATFKKTSLVFFDKDKSDYIINNKTGFIIKNLNCNLAAQKIVDLYKNKEKRIKMGQAAYKLIKYNFSKKNFYHFKKEILLKI